MSRSGTARELAGAGGRSSGGVWPPGGADGANSAGRARVVALVESGGSSQRLQEPGGSHTACPALCSPPSITHPLCGPTRTRCCAPRWQASDKAIRNVDYSAAHSDGVLFACDEGGACKLWAADSGEHIATLEAPPGGLQCVVVYYILCAVHSLTCRRGACHSAVLLPRKHACSPPASLSSACTSWTTLRSIPSWPPHAPPPALLPCRQHTSAPLLPTHLCSPAANVTPAPLPPTHLPPTTCRHAARHLLPLQVGGGCGGRRHPALHPAQVAARGVACQVAAGGWPGGRGELRVGGEGRFAGGAGSMHSGRLQADDGRLGSPDAPPNRRRCCCSRPADAPAMAPPALLMSSPCPHPLCSPQDEDGSIRLVGRTRKPVAPSPICGFELSRSGELLAAVTPDGARDPAAAHPLHAAAAHPLHAAAAHPSHVRHCKACVSLSALHVSALLAVPAQSCLRDTWSSASCPLGLPCLQAAL